jgi:hypothetical protein
MGGLYPVMMGEALREGFRAAPFLRKLSSTLLLLHPSNRHARALRSPELIFRFGAFR